LGGRQTVIYIEVYIFSYFTLT
jgi:hypothetical protein